MKGSSRRVRERLTRYLAQIGFVFVILVGCTCLLTYSLFCKYGISYMANYVCGYTTAWILNILTLGVVVALFMVIFNRLWLSCLLCSLICGVISIVNHYVIQFHSMPLSFLLLRNFRTAMNVVGSYDFVISKSVALLFFGTIFLIVLCLTYKKFFEIQSQSKHCTWIRRGILFVGSVLCFYVCYLSPNALKPEKTLNWSWRSSYAQYGYMACTVESGFQLFNVISEPDGYDQENVNMISRDYKASDSNDQHTFPDIILIMNESFYDLEQVANLDTDVPYMNCIDTMDNLLRGSAVVPLAGGVPTIRSMSF